MRWWSHLYLGKKARPVKDGLMEKISQGRPVLPDVYVITLPEYGHHLFDILPALLLTHRQRQDEGLVVLGLAWGYKEAKELVCQMVQDMHQATGGFDWKRYMEQIGE